VYSLTFDVFQQPRRRWHSWCACESSWCTQLVKYWVVVAGIMMLILVTLVSLTGYRRILEPRTEVYGMGRCFRRSSACTSMVSCIVVTIHDRRGICPWTPGRPFARDFHAQIWNCFRGPVWTWFELRRSLAAEQSACVSTPVAARLMSQLAEHAALFAG